MYNKNITESNYKQIVLKGMIMLCWLLLLICFIVKIFGGNFFEFIGESDFCEYIEGDLFLLTLIQFIFYFIGTSYVYKITFSNKKIILSLILIVIMFSFKVICVLGFIPLYFCFIFEIIGTIIIPILLKEKWYKVLIIQLLIIIYQMISMFTKNIAVFNFPDTNIVGYLYSFDYYILLILTYLYYKRSDFNMRLGLWFMSKDVDQLQEYKKIVVSKHENKIAKIDKKINKAKSRVK